MRSNMDSNQKIFLSVIVAVALCMSFLFGIFFEKSSQSNRLNTTIPEVFITQQKTQLKIETDGWQVDVFVDGEKYTQ